MRTKWTTIVCGIAIAGLALVGCDRDKISVYQVPKEAEHAEDDHAGHDHSAEQAPAAPITWTVPDGWMQLPGKGMRYATLVVEPGDTPLELSVIPLGLMARDVLQNVNRWRDQLGLEPIQADQLDTVVETVAIGEHTASVVNLTGQGQSAGQMLAAIVVGPEKVWFIKLTGTSAKVAPHEAAFAQFVHSIRLTGAAAAGAAPPPADDGTIPADPHAGVDMGGGKAPADPHAGVDMGGAKIPADPHASTTKPGALFTYDTPEQWRQLAKAGSMRLVAFTIDDEKGGASMEVSRFRGDVGGKLANIRRWRGQVGLGGIRDLSEQPVTSVQVDGIAGDFIDLAGAKVGMLVVSVPKGGYTWFFKMTGPTDLLAKQKPAFEGFVASVAFGGEAGE